MMLLKNKPVMGRKGKNKGSFHYAFLYNLCIKCTELLCAFSFRESLIDLNETFHCIREVRLGLVETLYY